MKADILAVVAVSVVSMIIGFVWYSLPVFGTVWMKEIGLSKDDIGKGPGIGYLFTTLSSALMGFVLIIFAKQMGVDTLVEGLKLGFLGWVGFVATTFTANYVFTQKSLKLFLIDTGYFLVQLLAAGAIVGALK